MALTSLTFKGYFDSIDKKYQNEKKNGHKLKTIFARNLSVNFI